MCVFEKGRNGEGEGGSVDGTFFKVIIARLEHAIAPLAWMGDAPPEEVGREWKNP